MLSHATTTTRRARPDHVVVYDNNNIGLARVPGRAAPGRAKRGRARAMAADRDKPRYVYMYIELTISLCMAWHGDRVATNFFRGEFFVGFLGSARPSRTRTEREARVRTPRRAETRVGARTVP